MVVQRLSHAYTLEFTLFVYGATTNKQIKRKKKNKKKIDKESATYKNVVQYIMFKMTNDSGKKNRENLSMYNAVARPLQNVSYCGANDVLCSIDFRYDFWKKDF